MSRKWLERRLSKIDHTGLVLQEVLDERRSQDEKWGEQNHPDAAGNGVEGRRYSYAGSADLIKNYNDRAAEAGVLDWEGILLEEVYEALAESDPAKLREELIQVAAVAAAWVECIDRREAVAA